MTNEELKTQDWHISRFTGLFTECARIPARAHDPEVFVHSGTLLPCPPRNEALPVGGAGWDEQSAELACLGEGIERLQPARLAIDSFVESSFENWNRAELAMDPARWVLFLPEQYAQKGFPFEPLTRSTVCRWICSRNALTGEPCWIPEDMAFLFSKDTHRFAPAISTGLACGRFGDPVLLRGLQEVIERDAIVGAWWNRYPLEEWEPNTVCRSLQAEIESRVMRPNLTYRFYRVTSPFSSNVTIVTLEGEDREGYCFSVGSACRETLAASWTKSILEAVHGRFFVRYMLSIGERHDHLPRTFAEHALYYSLHPEKVEQTVLRRPCKPPSRISSEPETVRYLSDRLGKDRPVLFRVMTPPGIAQEFSDWHVLKVVVPGLQPLHGTHEFPHLGGELWKPRGLADWQSMPPHPIP
jgi:ribosomal protein S12 methylthiotransferase accessory factor